MKHLIGILIFVFSIAAQANLVPEGYFITDPNHKWLEEIKKQPDLTIDHVQAGHFEVWGPRGLGQWLKKNQIDHKSLTNLKLRTVGGYASHEEVSAELTALVKNYPKTAKLFSIGNSTEGRPLWVVKISRNVGVDDTRPEFKFIANMHGDEIVGRELMRRLIRELLEQDGKDPVVTHLLDSVQIYILPSMNPDGATYGTRGNALDIDLNRDFPDFSTSDNVNTTDHRAVETQAIMNWQATRKFRLSANFHGGAEVVNYPWDAIPDPHPLDSYVKALSLEYANLAPYISASTEFENGITNGYAWYEVLGGMQDWSYHWYNDIQLTIEVSITKWPEYSKMDYYWNQNRNALLNYIGKVTEL